MKIEKSFEEMDNTEKVELLEEVGGFLSDYTGSDIAFDIAGKFGDSEFILNQFETRVTKLGEEMEWLADAIKKMKS